MDALPPELLERIVQYSEVAATGNLRLTCRELAVKAVCGEYARHLRQRTVCWTAEDSVESFTRLVAQPPLGLAARLLEIVTIAGRCNHRHGGTLEIDETDDGDEDTATRRRHALHHLGATLDLESQDDLHMVLAVHDTRPISPFFPPKLSMARGRGVPPNDWTPTWECAAATFAFAVDLLAGMQNRIIGLDLFINHDQECALAIDQLGQCFRDQNLVSCLRQLRTISMRLSHSMGSEPEEDSPVAFSVSSAEGMTYSEDTVLSKATNESPEIACYVRDFLALCPMLRTLHIHWFKLTSSYYQSFLRQARFFDHLEATKLPHLQNLSLAGIVCQGEILAAFAAAHSTTLRCVSLDEIKLHSGTFQPFFASLHANTPHLEAYDFDNLYEGKHRICFLVPGKPNVRSLDPSDGPNRLKRARQEVHLPIQYRWQRGPSVGCPQLFIQARSRVRKYGPPQATYYHYTPDTASEETE